MRRPKTPPPTKSPPPAPALQKECRGLSFGARGVGCDNNDNWLKRNGAPYSGHVLTRRFCSDEVGLWGQAKGASELSEAPFFMAGVLEWGA